MAKRVLTNPCATNVYLPAELKKRARAAAVEKNMSLSELIQRLLVAEIKRKRGIAHLNGREVAA
jgi:post-segregation antitoxin (ccd killing protein)